MLDACARKVKARVKVWPSARASQMVAKCRKKHGHVRKGEKGKSLRRWSKEKWKDKITGKPCGQGGEKEYCRPSKRVSKKTPVSRPGKKALRKNIAAKRAGKRASSLKRH